MTMCAARDRLRANEIPGVLAQSTYEAGADLAGWDRGALERKPPGLSGGAGDLSEN